MKSIDRRMLVVALLMFAGAALAHAMKPTQKIADARDRPDLNAMIPQQIADWKIDTSIVPIEPSPDAQAYLDKIYNQTLSRTYVHPGGASIMLSIAYGADQSNNLRVHAPEVCYVAQGFEVLGTVVGALATQYGPLPVQRLFAVRGSRNEPITYWVVVGDKATPAGIKQKLAQLSYGLTGKVPDAFLVRVSSLSSDPPDAYRWHEDFIKAMLGAMNEKNRVRITGQIGGRSLAVFSGET
jgi:EpsI family protein